MDDKKRENLEFFRTKLPELLENPVLRHKFVVVHGLEVQGAFDTFDAALRHAVARFPSTEFIIQRVIDDRDVISFIRAAAS